LFLPNGNGAGIGFVQGTLDVGEAVAIPVIKAVKRHADTRRTVILDAAPGTACPMAQTVRGADYCLLVTEPTPFGLNDLQLAVGVARALGVPCGVVESLRYRRRCRRRVLSTKGNYLRTQTLIKTDSYIGNLWKMASQNLFFSMQITTYCVIRFVNHHDVVRR
jgi:MinD superfamily P-loop ATPase